MLADKNWIYQVPYINQATGESRRRVRKAHMGSPMPWKTSHSARMAPVVTTAALLAPTRWPHGQVCAIGLHSAEIKRVNSREFALKLGPKFGKMRHIGSKEEMGIKGEICL